MSEREKQEHSGGRTHAPRGSAAAKPAGPAINVDRHLASRKAVGELLNRQKVFICSQHFAEGRVRSTRVLVRGEYYDVNDHQLTQLQNGLSPADLMLEPAQEEL